MVQSTAEKIKLWQGPAILSYGFRPFFLLGALWAAFAMVLWIMALSGRIELPSSMDPVSWHAHAFLFGYTGAIIAGFLLTAVPNWTGRLPVVGWKLVGLAALWGAGRVTIFFSAFLPFESVVVIDLAFPVVLSVVILREIVVGKKLAQPDHSAAAWPFYSRQPLLSCGRMERCLRGSRLWYTLGARFDHAYDRSDWWAHRPFFHAQLADARRV